jgi:uncharacterized membrane protein YoaK (UPF0700 family)
MPGRLTLMGDRLRTEDLRDVILILLAFGAGAVDAISFLGLGRVFTANMTGNIVLLGLAAGSSAGSEATRSGISLVAFIAAVAVALWLSHRSRHGRLPAGVVAALGLEVLAQVGFLVGWLLASGRPGGVLEAVLVGVSALAMGLQSGAVARLGVRGVSTTYITGTMVGLIGELISPSRSRRDSLRRGFVLVVVLAGAACGAVIVTGPRRLAPVVPLVMTVFAATGAAFLMARDE